MKSDRETNKWITVAEIAILQLFVVVTLDLWLAMASGVSVLFGLPRAAFGITALALFSANAWLLLRSDPWQDYAARYDRYSRRERTLRAALVWAIVVAIVSVFGVTSYAFFRMGRPGTV